MSITTVVFTPYMSITKLSLPPVVWWLYEYNDGCLYPRLFGGYMSITKVVFTPSCLVAI